MLASISTFIRKMNNTEMIPSTQSYMDLSTSVFNYTDLSPSRQSYTELLTTTPLQTENCSHTQFSSNITNTIPGITKPKNRRKQKLIKERTYECSECHKIFNRKYNLSVHVERRHRRNLTPESMVQSPVTVTRSFICSICGRGFSMACHLAVHLKFHRLKDQSSATKGPARKVCTNTCQSIVLSDDSSCASSGFEYLDEASVSSNFASERHELFDRKEIDYIDFNNGFNIKKDVEHDCMTFVLNFSSF